VATAGRATGGTGPVMHALGNRIWGFSPELFDEAPQADAPAPGREEQQARMAEFAQRYPHVVEIAVAATQGDPSGVGGGCDEQFEFAFALDLLLDGFDRLRQQGLDLARGAVRRRPGPSRRPGLSRRRAVSRRRAGSLPGA
jgi:hypothetical protein